MDHAEKIAKVIIESLIPDAVMHYRIDQSNGTYDFDLNLAGTSIAAVEVTASVDECYEATTAAIREPRKGGPFVKARKCQQDWLVHPSSIANINKIRKHIDQYLAEVEAAGLKRFRNFIDADRYPSVERIYQDLDIEAGNVTKWKEPGQIGMALPGGGGQITVAHLQTAIKLEAFKEDNRRKLGSVSSEERHLFVYIHPDNFSPWVALRDKEPPLEPPHLPPEITHVWAVAEVSEPSHCVIWRARNNAWWEKLGVIVIAD